ncbi:MAG: Y-family DNA polymerase [Rhodomicrobium sp.]
MDSMMQKRAMFVWLPNFAMTLARLKQPPLAEPKEPLALIEKHGNIRRIAALDGPAMQAGLHRHQPLADALAIYPKLIVADAEPEAPEQALMALAVSARRYSPFTAPARGSGLWLDITGCAHLWGGEAGLTQDLLGRLEARGILARAAIAPTFGAAYALALHAERYVIADSTRVMRGSPSSCPTPVPHPLAGAGILSCKLGMASLLGEGTPSQRARTAPSPLAGEGRGEGDYLAALLAPLPVERLRIGEETASLLRKLGLFTIGDVQKLSRAGLSRRFPGLLPQLDKAMGVAQEAIEFLRPSTPWIERLRFAEPVSAPGDLERITAKLLEMLCARLEAGRQGGLKFEISFFRSDGGVETQAVSAALPTRDAPRIMRLFREKLGLIDPGFGVDLAMLAAPNTEPLDERQSSILQSGQNTACLEELASLIDTLENRLGKGRIFRLAPQESYIPERAVKRQAVIPETSKALSGIVKDTKRRFRKDPGYRQAGSGTTPTHRHPGNANGVIRDLKRSELGDTSSGRIEVEAWQHLGERPIRLFAQPQPIDVTAALPDSPPVLFRWRKVLHRIARAEGPERISPEWWRGSDAEGALTRDYYRVESVRGLRFWVFREGAYGAGRLPRWFLHGLFP